MTPNLPAASLSRLSEFLSRRVGLDFPATRKQDLARGIHGACRDFGFADPVACIDWLAAETLTQSQIETLASHFTIGETYFFREPQAFAALEKEILPELIRKRRRGERRLRLWSAGCASGEEAYSLAMLICRLLPDLADWQVTILGTDINPLVLRKAAAGLFGEWSFRSAPAWVKEQYFAPAGDHGYRIRPALRSMVSFAYLNLAEDVFPSLLGQTTAMDIIFCRNVLLYFCRDRAEQVTRRFHHTLLEGGWLVGGIAEHFQAPGFVPAQFDGATLFRKASEKATAARTAPDLRKPPDLAKSAPLVKPPRPAKLPKSAPSAVPSQPAPAPVPKSLSPAELAKSCANQGHLQEALEHCDRAIRGDKLVPEHHYLRATILTELGKTADAESAFRRTLYLDPDFVLAHFALATLTRKLGRTAESRKHLENASALVAACDPEALLPGSDGLTARRIASFVQAFATQNP